MTLRIAIFLKHSNTYASSITNTRQSIILLIRYWFCTNFKRFWSFNLYLMHVNQLAQLIRYWLCTSLKRFWTFAYYLRFYAIRMILLLIRNRRNFSLYSKLTCYDEHDSHNAVRNCRVLESDAKYDDFLQTFSSFCVQSRCNVELFVLLIFMRQLYRTISSSSHSTRWR